MIQLKDIAITAGDFQLTEINLTIATGKYGVLMGRTGSGKTTLLRQSLEYLHFPPLVITSEIPDISSRPSLFHFE